jgi:hypothetical protein
MLETKEIRMPGKCKEPAMMAFDDGTEPFPMAVVSESENVDECAQLWPSLLVGRRRLRPDVFFDSSAFLHHPPIVRHCPETSSHALSPSPVSTSTSLHTSHIELPLPKPFLSLFAPHKQTAAPTSKAGA